MSARKLPWEIDDARAVLAQASRDQAAQQDAVRDAVRDAAKADHLHRVALARKIAELRSDGMAATLAKDLAKGDQEISFLRVAADEAEGDREIAVQEGWRLHANRKDSQQLAEWSMRKDLAIDLGTVPEPARFENVTPRRQG